jgi:dynein light chain roadblock-type
MADTEPSTSLPQEAAPVSAKSKANFSEVQETVSRLASHKGVTSVLILNQAGDILTQTGQGTVGNPKLLKNTLQAAARYIQSIPSDENEHMEGTEGHDVAESGPFGKLSFVRIRSNREEILVAPKNQYVLVVMQDPTLATL